MELTVDGLRERPACAWVVLLDNRGLLLRGGRLTIGAGRERPACARVVSLNEAGLVVLRTPVDGFSVHYQHGQLSNGGRGRVNGTFGRSLRGRKCAFRRHGKWEKKGRTVKQSAMMLARAPAQEK